MTPVSLQLSRKKGFNLRALSLATNGLEVVNVSRSGKLGNPFIVGNHGTRAECVDLHRKLLAGYVCISVDRECIDAQRAHRAFVEENRKRYRGMNVACWCRGEPCHRDTLREVFNNPKGKKS